jgi:hypothetical protein
LIFFHFLDYCFSSYRHSIQVLLNNADNLFFALILLRIQTFLAVINQKSVNSPLHLGLAFYILAKHLEGIFYDSVAPSYGGIDKLLAVVDPILFSAFFLSWDSLPVGQILGMRLVDELGNFSLSLGSCTEEH